MVVVVKGGVAVAVVCECTRILTHVHSHLSSPSPPPLCTHTSLYNPSLLLSSPPLPSPPPFLFLLYVIGLRRLPPFAPSVIRSLGRSSESSVTGSPGR